MSENKKIQVVSFQSLSANSGMGMARLGFFLSKELHKRHLLQRFIVHSKGKFETPFPSDPVTPLSRYYLFALNRLNSIFRFKAHKFRLVQELLFDWFCTFKINDSIGLLFVTQPYLYRTLKKAKKLGIKTILLTGTPEDNYIYRLVSEENAKLGNNEVDGYTYDQRNAYFNKSLQHVDVVIGFFPNIYKTYVHSDYKGRVVNISGHMPPDLLPVELKPRQVDPANFKVGFLAYTVILKGLHYLLQAWKELKEEGAIPVAELYVGGPVHPTVQAHIDKHYYNLPGVIYSGQVNDIGKFMQPLDLFVVPSLVDAGPASALEAAHYEVPVIITDNSGSSELIARGSGGGHVIPIRDVAALKEKILWAYTHREENIQMGKTARQNLATYSFDKYISGLSDFLQAELNG